MAKTIGYVLLWLAGSAAAVAVAWTGVSAVDDGIAPVRVEVAAIDNSAPGQASTPTTASASASTSSSPSSTPTPLPSPASPTTNQVTTVPSETQTRTYNLVGGTTAISFSPAGTRVLWALANPGYEVKIEDESPGVKVEFRSEEYESRIDAWWSDGPQDEIRERGHDDD